MWDQGGKAGGWWDASLFLREKKFHFLKLFKCQLTTNTNDKHNRQTKDITQTTNNTIPIWYSTYFANTFIHQSAIKILECKYKKWVQD
jgi:hypothetical protein